MAKKFHLQAIISAVDKITPTLKGVRLGVKMAHKSFKDLGSASRSLLGSLGLPATIGFAGFAYGAMRAANAAFSFAGATKDAAEIAGATTDYLQALQVVFGGAGVSAEGTNDSLNKLNKNMADAAAGKNAGFAELFRRMRVPLRDANGEIRKLDDVLPELAAAFEKNTDPAVRNRMAVEMFGKSGAKLIPILAAGKDGFKKLTDEAQRLGTGVSAKSIDNIDALSKKFDTLGQQMRAQTNEIIGELSPHVMPLVEGIVEWVAANKELIRAEVGAWIRDVAASIKGWLASGGMDRLKAGIESLVSGIGSFVNAMGGMRNVMIAFGVLIALGPAASIAQLAAVFVQIGTYVAPLVVKSLLVIGAAFKSVALALLTNPIGLVVTGIALAAGLLIYNWDKIGPWFASLWTNVQGYFRGAWEGIKTLLSWSPLGLVMKTWEPLVSWFSGLWDRVKGFIEPIVSAGKAVGGWFGGGKQAQQSGGLAGGRSPLVAAGGLASQANVSGEMRVRFENAPPGMRVDQGKTNQSALAFNPDVGYRMAAY